MEMYISEAEDKMDIQGISGLIRSRRSIFPFMFTGELISDRIVEQLLENANWAPNHKKTEPWRFHIITGDYRKVLSDFASKWYKENTSAENYSELKFKKIKTKPLQSSHIILICMQRDPEERVPEWEEVAAVACAVQNLWLSCQPAGVGGYWSTPKYSKEIGQIVELGEGESCLGMFYLGVPEKSLYLSAERRSIASKTKWYREDKN